MGYGAFHEKFFSDKAERNNWIDGVIEFFSDLGQKNRDFRVYRVQYLLKNSLDLLELFDEAMITPKLMKKKRDIEMKLGAIIAA